MFTNMISSVSQFAYRVWDVEPDFRNPEKAALEGIKSLKEFFASLGIPVTLTDVGIPDDKFDEMAKKATEDGPLGQFVKLYKDDVKKIYELAK